MPINTILELTGSLIDPNQIPKAVDVHAAPAPKRPENPTVQSNPQRVRNPN